MMRKQRILIKVVADHRVFPASLTTCNLHPLIGSLPLMTHHADQAVAQPASTDIVIIGGGVAGVSVALFLAEAGIAAVLCEKGRIAGEQSSRNWGWIRKQGRAFEKLPLMVRIG